MHERIDCPIDDVSIYRLTTHKDDRGSLQEIWRTDERFFDLDMTTPKMCYVSRTEPGVTRGPHEHKVQWDRFAFVDGVFTLYLWENRERVPQLLNYRKRWCMGVGEQCPVLVEIPPGVVHAYQNTTTRSALVINMPNRLFAGHQKKEQIDEIRHEDVEGSPFRTLGWKPT